MEFEFEISKKLLLWDEESIHGFPLTLHEHVLVPPVLQHLPTHEDVAANARFFIVIKISQAD